MEQNLLTIITGLTNVKRLRTLCLNKNKICSMDGLNNLYNLSVINLENNNITEITYIDGLFNLTDLFLILNPIKYINELELLKYKSLKYVDFYVKPILQTYIEYNKLLHKYYKTEYGVYYIDGLFIGNVFEVDDIDDLPIPHRTPKNIKYLQDILKKSLNNSLNKYSDENIVLWNELIDNLQ